MAGETNGWDQYKLLVLDALERIEDRQEKVTIQLDVVSDSVKELRTEIKTVKYIGGVGLPVVVSLVVSWIGRKIGIGS